MPSKARAKFELNKTDIQQLWLIHGGIAGSGPGRKRGVDVLNRAAIVFISACWESYIEDVASEAFDFMLDNASNPDVIPIKVRTLASRSLRESSDERKVWELAGDGWKSVLKAHRDIIKQKWLGDFNTPKSNQVKELFQSLLDLKDITQFWVRKRLTIDQVTQRLDEYMTIRGNIAHRIKHDKQVYKNWGTDFLQHVEQLVEKTDDALNQHLEVLTNKKPW